MVIHRAPGRRGAPRGGPLPMFLSQMIAEREGLPAQRRRRRAPLITAISAYAEGEHRDRRRLPLGFYASRLV